MPRTNPTSNWNDEEFVRRVREAMERAIELRTTQQRRYNDTDEMPDERPASVPCLNCGTPWHDHRGWACPTFWRGSPDVWGRNWSLSELLPDSCYTTSDMPPRNCKKFSRVNPRKLRKRERENLLSKESLLK